MIGQATSPRGQAIVVSRFPVTRGVCRSLLGPLSLAALLVLASPAGAQNARVVTSSASNGKILEIGYFPPSSALLNADQNERVSLESIVFREDGARGLHLVVADTLGGQVVFYPGGAGNGQVVLDATNSGHPAFPNGLSQDPARNLYGTTSSTGNSINAVPKVWVLRHDPGCPGSPGNCAPGGYVLPVGYLDSLAEGLTTIGGVPTRVEADLIEDSHLVVSNVGNLVAGDLLVLSASPAMCLRYPAAAIGAFLDELALGNVPAEIEPEVFIHPPSASVPAERRFPDGASPNGLDLTPEGNLLVSAGEGLILNYEPDGTRLANGAGGFVDFASGLGQGKFKIAVGLQDGDYRAFVTDRNGGEVLRFRIEEDGTGTLEASVPDPEFPVGIATTTSAVQATPAGPGVPVSSSNILTSTIEVVPTAGQTSAREFTFVDPREAEVSTPPGQPLHRSLFLGEISSLLPANVEIPAYVRSFRKDDPVNGAPTFLLVEVDSSAGMLGLVSHHGDESLVLGYSADCNDPSSASRPRLFWTPSMGEPPIPEGPTFINVSSDCGSSVGLTKRMSLFLVSARDVRPLPEIIQAQLDGLGQLLDASPCISKKIANTLRREYDAAVREWGRGKVASTIDRLQRFVAVAEGSPSAFVSCPNNEGGGLRARAKAALFNLTSPP